MPAQGTGEDANAHPEIQRARHLLQAGQVDEAALVCQRVRAAEPDNAAAYNLLGGVALRQNAFQSALECFTRAIEIDAAEPSSHQGLGIAHCNLRQLADAERCFQRALELEPKNPAAHNNLGNCYEQGGDFSAALRCYRKAIAANSSYLPAHINLADLQARRLDYKSAVDTYRKALRVGGDSRDNQASIALVYHRMGLALCELNETDEAIASYREAIARQPGFALAHNSLGGALLARNEPEAALACFRQALQCEPARARMHSNILLALNYLPGVTQQELQAESAAFDEQHAKALMQGRKPFRNVRNKQRVLRVGYLSPDFREHSVAHFTRKLFGCHDREAVEVFAYADVERPDDWTGQFQAQADHWLSIVDMDDEDVAERIRADRIDILVDLAGHTSNNRLLVFARKPAPIQVNWLGYPNTTGMRAMDYRVTDAVADPPGVADELHVEKLVRLEQGFLCYQVDETRVEVARPPCVRQGYVTFGSFNAISKLSPDAVRTWSQLLSAVPDARLLLKSKALEDAGTNVRLRDAFAAHGISADRLQLINTVPHRRDHLELYSRVDVGLDPFPYNGTTTTFEALWMGVPVICLRGDRHAGRVGASIMQHAGWPELVADTVDDYIDLATALAADVDRLVALRKGMRSRLRESVLMDVSAFTANLEQAFRQMWITWCNSTRRRAGK